MANLQERLNNIISLKEAAGRYEVIDDTVTADIYDSKSDAMLQQLNEELLQKVAPNDFQELPARAKLLLQQLSRLYVRLYAEINTGAEPSMYTAIMHKLKETLPGMVTGGLMASILMKFLQNSNRNIIYAFLGWVISCTLYNTGNVLINGNEKALPASVYPILDDIAKIEKQLSKYGITFKPIQTVIPQVNRGKYYVV